MTNNETVSNFTARQLGRTDKLAGNGPAFKLVSRLGQYLVQGGYQGDAFYEGINQTARASYVAGYNNPNEP